MVNYKQILRSLFVVWLCAGFGSAYSVNQWLASSVRPSAQRSAKIFAAAPNDLSAKALGINYFLLYQTRQAMIFPQLSITCHSGDDGCDTTISDGPVNCPLPLQRQ